MLSINPEDHLFKMAVQSDAHVLILGATGTGKTTLARQIHDRSLRRDKPFVTVNLATLHEGTLESELFGHEKGAFTGAETRRIGRFEMANGGTVFLDEIGELSPRLQARLLEFIQSQKISPLGSNREMALNVRVIAATNVNLTEQVRKGTFREDLFHRLRVITFELKSLRDRMDDFDTLLHKFLEESAKRLGRRVLRISESVAVRLESHGWPGNLRALRNVLDYMVLSCEGEEIQDRDLPSWFVEEECAHSALPAQAGLLGVAEVPLTLDFQETLERFEKEFLRRALARCRGRINRTARETRINKTTLIRRIRAYGLGSLIRDREVILP